MFFSDKTYSKEKLNAMVEFEVKREIEQYIKAEQCEHDYDKWQEPLEADITVSHSNMGGYGTSAYKGLSQLRFCKKCNAGQRKII